MLWLYDAKISLDPGILQNLLAYPSSSGIAVAGDEGILMVVMVVVVGL